MIILNFAHPLTEPQIAQLAQLTGQDAAPVLSMPTQFDNSQSFAEQVRALVDSLALTPEQWQTTPILINPPAYAPVAVTLLAELHGRMGHFPAVIRIRPLPDTTPTQYEIAELVNLQAVRDAARLQRQSTPITPLTHRPGVETG